MQPEFHLLVLGLRGNKFVPYSALCQEMLLDLLSGWENLDQPICELNFEYDQDELSRPLVNPFRELGELECFETPQKSVRHAVLHEPFKLDHPFLNTLCHFNRLHHLDILTCLVDNSCDFAEIFNVQLGNSPSLTVS